MIDSYPARAALLLMGLSMTSVKARAEQFVLFDVTFTYTKHDADHSRPSKSHYYVRGKDLNPDRPRDWTAPVDYRNGTVHIRTEVIDKPAGGAPTTWSICYIPNKGKGNGYGCTGTVVYREKGVYEQDVSMTRFWENDSIVWTEGVKQMDLVIKDDSGGAGHAHKRADHEKFFPTKMRITLVQVSAGSKYDPSLVPNLPAKSDGQTASTGPEAPNPIRVGQVAPQVVAYTSGGDFDIPSYYKNRYVLLTFWSLNDKAGARQFAELKKIRQGLAREDRLLILSVCTDEMEDHWDDWLRFLDAEGKVAYGDRDRAGPFRFFEDHKWVNVMQDVVHVNTAEVYGVDRLPDAFLIAPDRRLKAVRIPVEELRGAIEKALSPGL